MYGEVLGIHLRTFGGEIIYKAIKAEFVEHKNFYEFWCGIVVTENEKDMTMGLSQDDRIWCVGKPSLGKMALGHVFSLI